MAGEKQMLMGCIKGGHLIGVYVYKPDLVNVETEILPCQIFSVKSAIS